MSLVGTLGKIAMGVLVAKGVGKVMNNKGGGGGLGGLLGGASGGGGLGGLLSGAAGGGGLGGLLGGALGGSGNNANSGGGLLGGGQSGGQSGGGLGGLLDQLGGGQQQQQQGAGGGFGDLFNSALAGNEPQQVDQAAEQQAEVLLRAMLNAAKADGEIDQTEQQKITQQLDGISDEEAEFIRREMASPLDFDAFVNSVPNGMQQQVYLMSLMAIDLDSQAEAQYLDRLAKSLNISQQQSNQIHQQLGAPTLYS